MNCVTCGESATQIKEVKQARYRAETVEAPREFFRCGSCKEEFVTPAQMRLYVRAVKMKYAKSTDCCRQKKSPPSAQSSN